MSVRVINITVISGSGFDSCIDQRRCFTSTWLVLGWVHYVCWRVNHLVMYRLQRRSQEFDLGGYKC